MLQTNPLFWIKLFSFFFLTQQILSVQKCEDFISKFPTFTCPVNSFIGEGAFGLVYLIENPTTQRAVKVQEFDQKRSEHEFEVMRNLDHPNILKVFENIHDGDHSYISMEFAQKGNLRVFLTQNAFYFQNEKSLLEFFSKIVDAVFYLEQKKIVHADLKLKNVVLTEKMEPKLIDFDFSTIIGSEKKLKGSLRYLDPDLILGFENNNGKYVYDNSNDVYALGVMLYWMSQDHQFPFEALNKEEIKTELIKGQFKIRRGTSFQMAQLIYGCLRRDKRSRISIERLKENLEKALKNPNTHFLQQNIELSNFRKIPFFMVFEANGLSSIFEEFSEMIFVFLLAFVLIPLSIYCLKRKLESGQENSVRMPLDVQLPGNIIIQNQPVVIVG